MSNFDQDLDKNPSNFIPLSPITFLERAKDVYPDYEALVYEDRNNNSVLDMGSFTTNQFAERFFVYPDSLSLRANWELEIPKWNYNMDKAK